MIGQTISHYQILEKLGEGGMGVVYKARDTNLDRDVALKFLPPHLSASTQDKARFIQEAKAASALNHPNVCTIHDIQEHDQQMFIVMEFVDGQTLREKKESLSFKQAIDISIQVADGLAAAHEKGIVHRDIKPENIMIRRDGIAQIMDFGLAKLRASGSNITRLTKEGSTVGTAGYMSPEQVQGQETDHRSDIFSFGVLLYEMLTGQLPFKGVHETALAYEIVNVDPVPMSMLRPEIDQSLDAIVLECLEKDANERSQSMKQVSIDLKRYKRESSRHRASRITAARPAIKTAQSPEIAVPAGGGLKRNFGYMLSGLLALAVILLVWGPWRKETGAAGPIVRASINLSKDAPLDGFSAGVTVSPDGKYLAYDDLRQIYLRRLDQSTSQPIPGTGGGIEPAFSPDGRWIVFFANYQIIKISVTGGAPEVLCRTQGFAPGLFWAADNTILFGTYSGPIFRVPATGGIPAAVTALDSSAGDISHRFPQLLPDGKTIIFMVKSKNIVTFDDAVIVAQRLDGGERKVLVRGGFYPTYAPTGHIVYERGNTIYAVQFDAENLEVAGSPVPIEEGGLLNKGGTACFGFSDNGILVYSPPSVSQTLNNYSLGWLDRNGGTHPLYDTLRFYSTPSLSPDGQKVATGIIGANNDIWVYHIPRGVLTRLTFGGGNNDYPIWSPDGRYLVYAAEKGKAANLFRKPWDGSGAEERLTSSPNTQQPVAISQDGSVLSFNEDGDIWILPLDSSGAGGERKPYPFIQSPASEKGGWFSPDGRWMAYNSNESGKDEVYVVAFPKREGKWQISNGGGGGGNFSRDGKELFFGNGSSVMKVDVLGTSTFDFSVPKKVCDVTKNVTLFDVSADGQRFLAMIDHSQQLTLTQLDVVTGWFEVLKSKFAGNRN